ncbi:hypothetical protein HS7_18150 [Sulfolobales archaeon HS-7]|nr:hypothetical protein HS7_18150 [Sulfolobales archaeon HS-7]
MSIDDKILAFRAFAAIICAIISFVFGVMGMLTASYLTPLVIYLLTIPAVKYTTGTNSRWLIIGKGSLTFVVIWFLIWTVLLQL